jgi:hypothetical protein
MAYTYEQLHLMTVTQLREIAKTVEHDAVKGFSTMHKEKLVPALCTALGIESHLHHHVIGVDKANMKAQIRALKAEKAAALTAKDRKKFKEILHSIHRLKRSLRKATV